VPGRRGAVVGSRVPGTSDKVYCCACTTQQWPHSSARRSLTQSGGELARARSREQPGRGASNRMQMECSIIRCALGLEAEAARRARAS
jgi:hypothetical protein